MQYNFGTAIDSIKQKTWWKWCLMLIPYAYLSIAANGSPESLKSIHWIWYLLFIISLFFMPGFLGFLVTYAKKFAHNELEQLELISFKEFSKKGIHYLGFLILYTILTCSIFVMSFIVLAIISIPLIILLFAINKILALVVGILIGITTYIAFVLAISVFVITAQILYIETGDILSIFKFKEIWYLYNNNKLAIFKCIGWIFLISIIIIIPQTIIALISLISTTALGIGASLLLYATAIMSFNLYGQLINHTKIQIEELTYN